MKKTVFVLASVLVFVLLIGMFISFNGPTLVSSLSKYTSFTFNNPPITLSLPEGTKVTDKYQGRNEVLFSTYFKDPNLNLRGYVQLWELSNLEAFLAGSKQRSTFNYTAYNIKQVQIKQYQGYLVEWSAAFGRYYYISGKEYWLKKDNSRQVLRVSFFVDQAQFPKGLEPVVNTVLASLKW